MDCIIKEVIALDKSGICPYAGQKCDGIQKMNWSESYTLIPETKVCLAQGAKGSCFVEISGADMEQIGTGQAVLMIRAAGGSTVFVKAKEA